MLCSEFALKSLCKLYCYPVTITCPCLLQLLPGTWSQLYDNCMAAPTESKIRTTDQSAWTVVPFYKLKPQWHCKEWHSDTEFTNAIIFHSQTASTSENANNYGDHLQLVKDGAAVPVKTEPRYPWCSHKPSEKFAWSCWAQTVGHIPFKMEQCSESQCSYLWSRPMSSPCSASFRLNKHLRINSLRLL